MEVKLTRIEIGLGVALLIFIGLFIGLVISNFELTNKLSDCRQNLYNKDFYKEQHILVNNTLIDQNFKDWYKNG